MGHRFESVQQVRDGLKQVHYLADDGIAGVAFLADRLGKPVLVEGPAGKGKTQLAKSVAEMTGARLIRLQCYEGLDESKALYEWNYKKQLLRIQADRSSDSWSEVHDDIFSEEFLLTRPLLEAITADEPVVLLIDGATMPPFAPEPSLMPRPPFAVILLRLILLRALAESFTSTPSLPLAWIVLPLTVVSVVEVFIVTP